VIREVMWTAWDDPGLGHLPAIAGITYVTS
jgi:hypothetical protein